MVAEMKIYLNGLINRDCEFDPEHHGHDGCDSADCHWTPDGHETLYMDVDAARALRRELDAAIKQARKR